MRRYSRLPPVIAAFRQSFLPPMSTRPLLSILAAFAASTSQGAIVANPVVMASAPEFSGTYTAANLFDGNRDTEYASQGQGANTFVDMDFGTAVSMDRFFVITRLNNVDVVGTANLILSNNADFSSPLATIVIDPSGQNGAGLIASFASTTARYARWDVITSTGGSQNLGGIEMRFLNTPAGSFPVSASVIGGATAFNANYALANAANNNAGRDGSGNEYAINGGVTGPTNMFVDFDFGGITPISGFDFFDRMAPLDRNTAFDLIFSNDPGFSSVVATQSYTPGADWGYSQTFAPVNARYVRFDSVASNSNPGMAEIIFYAVPEPSTAMVAGMAGFLMMARRRRR
jgi:hypothetical protein